MKPSKIAAGRGFALIELLLTIGLLAAFLVIAARLFTATMRLTHRSAVAAAEVSAYESLVRTMRADVWSASAIALLPDGGVRLSGVQSSGGGGTVNWQREVDASNSGESLGDRLMIRGADRDGHADQKRWPNLPGEIVFEPTPTGLVIRSGDDQTELISQLLLIREGAR